MVAVEEIRRGMGGVKRRVIPRRADDMIGSAWSDEVSMSRPSRRRGVQARPVQPARIRVWKLAEARARFGELVGLALSVGPQRVTVRGRDAVIVVSAERFAELMARCQPSLGALLSTSPLRDLDLERRGQMMPVRDVPSM